MNEATLFEKFANQLSRWSKTGEEPKLGDWNIRAYLDLQEQRLKEKELKRTFDYSINGNGGFTRLSVTDYEFSLSFADRNKSVYCFYAGMQG